MVDAALATQLGPYTLACGPSASQEDAASNPATLQQTGLNSERSSLVYSRDCVSAEWTCKLALRVAEKGVKALKRQALWRDTKLDGQRTIVLVLDDERLVCVEGEDEQASAVCADESLKSLKVDSVLDAERVGEHLFVFDALVAAGRQVSQLVTELRRQWARKVCRRTRVATQCRFKEHGVCAGMPTDGWIEQWRDGAYDQCEYAKRVQRRLLDLYIHKGSLLFAWGDDEAPVRLSARYLPVGVPQCVTWRVASFELLSGDTLQFVCWRRDKARPNSRYVVQEYLPNAFAK
jgi:hypothetical protein